MNKNGEKLGSKLSNKEKLMFAGGALYSALLIIGGYKVGSKLYCSKAANWLHDCIYMDPEIGVRLAEVVTKVDKKLKK